MKPTEKEIEDRLRYLATHADGRVDRTNLTNIVGEFKYLTSKAYSEGWNDCLAAMPKKNNPITEHEAWAGAETPSIGGSYPDFRDRRGSMGHSVL